MRRLRLPFAAAAITAATLAGCHKPQITTYNAPKDAAPAIAGMPPGLVENSAPAPAVRWQLPSGWQDQGANNIRLGNILVTDAAGHRAEMTVTRFEGDVGGDLANVNRWRNQLQLAPIDDAALENARTHLDLPAGHADLVDLVSDAPLSGSETKTRTLVAWLKQPDATWFFKLSGSDSLVAAQRDSFDAFLRSVEFAPASPAPSGAEAGVSTNPLPSAGPLASVPMASSSLPASALSSSNALTWSAPPSWIEKPLGPVRKGSFTIRDASGGEADLSVTAFPGEVGGLLANLNRWRRELELAPIAENELTANTQSLAAGALSFTVVDFAGTSGGVSTRTLGAIVPVEGETYFFKLKGPDGVVAGEKSAFLEFLKSVKAR